MALPHTPQFERRVLLLMALVQFINIWDFMIVMPLGPDFAAALGIDAAQNGWIAGSYSVAASLAGLLSARFLDRFDRRNVLFFNLTGLMAGTMCMLLAHSFWQLVGVRFFTGLFGGTMVASSLAVIADVFPPERRGEAMGKVFGSFSVASVLGVPVGLEIATRFGWATAFMVISVCTGLVLVFIFLMLPPIRFHLENRSAQRYSLFSSLIHNPVALPAVFMIATGLFASFLIIPNISAHLQHNMGYPREHLGLLYFFGGGAAFFSMRWVGKTSDRVGYARMSAYATAGLWLALFCGFYMQFPNVPVMGVFILFMITMSTRNVTSNALVSKIPAPQERAGFMALLSAVQNLMAGVGAFSSTLLLHEVPDGHILGMEHVALLAMASFGVSVLLMFRIEKVLAKRHLEH